MALRPPSFRFVLALLGACLVVWGAKGQFLNTPVGVIQLFEFKRDLAWAFVFASVAVVPLALLKRPIFAWVGWLVALGVLGYILGTLWSQTQAALVAIEENNVEMKAMGFAPTKIDLSFSHVVRSGSVAVAAGMIIQFVGLCLRRKKEVTA